jgi:hypothetical protein
LNAESIQIPSIITSVLRIDKAGLNSWMDLAQGKRHVPASRREFEQAPQTSF